MPGWRIDKDTITQAGDSTPSRAGWQYGALTEPTIPFRLRDDDGILYYEGVVTDDSTIHDDDAPDWQYELLKWAEHDAGCTTIEVKRSGEWVQEIG